MYFASSFDRWPFVWVKRPIFHYMKSLHQGVARSRCALAGLALCVWGAFSSQALVITPVWDSTINNHANAATIKASINAAIQDYESRFSDPITVTIQFQGVTDGLGASDTFFDSMEYGRLRAAMVRKATTTNDTLALAHLPATTASPVNSISTVSLTLPHMRLMGVDSRPPAGQADSTISLNLDIMNFTRTSINPNKYDLISTVYHEINEVLGLNSALDGLNNGDPAPTDAIGVMDLFRYNQSGQRSFNTSVNTKAYFSLDGTHHIVQFNQDANGDFHDWDSGVAGQPERVQDAFGNPGDFQDQSDAELIALDVIGYTPIVIVPTPPILANPAFAGGHFGFDVSATSGQTVILDASTDLKTWTPVWTNTVNPTVHFSDTLSGTLKNRAYRARTP